MSIYYKLASDGVIWEKIGNQIVMANLNSGKYCNISENSGLYAWELIINGASSDCVHQALANIFTNYDETCKRQVEKYSGLEFKKS